MVIFLNAADSGRLGIGDEARVILDAVPDYVIPAEVSFVASDAQFTPKTVETESEREKLMFRVQLRVDRQVLKTYYGRVETGLRGSGFVRTRPDANWPPQLEVKLPPEPASPPIAEAPAPAPAEHAPTLAPAPTPAAQTAAPAPTPAAQTAVPAPAPAAQTAAPRRAAAYASPRSCGRHADADGSARSYANSAGGSSCSYARPESACCGANCRGARAFASGGDKHVRVHRAGARGRVRSREPQAVDWSLGSFRGRLRQTLPATR